MYMYIDEGLTWGAGAVGYLTVYLTLLRGMAERCKPLISQVALP